ncbi:MAG: cytochrome [Deltaproteobacteria bacterium]|nr:cytochrome [Deltaproteobacteria bacterium]
MAGSSIARRLDDPVLEIETKRGDFGGGEPPPVLPQIPIGNNLWLAVLMFIGAEAMFFAGLMGAYIVFRVGAAVWPPPFQPRLPVGVTGVNTVFLLASAVTIRVALRSARRGDGTGLVRWLGLTALLGATFLAVQGYEWAKLIQFGLTVSSSVYGGLFYTLIGFHALHVFGALIWLLVVFTLARRGRYTNDRYLSVQTCAMFWTFVVALWPALYGLVYLFRVVNEMKRKIFTILAYSSLALILVPALAGACSVCVTGDNDPTANAFNWSVLFLMATPYTVVGSIAGWLFFKYRRAATKTTEEVARQPALPLTWNEEEIGR